MKRYIVITVIAVIIFQLIACNKESSSDKTDGLSERSVVNEQVELTAEKSSEETKPLPDEKVEEDRELIHRWIDAEAGLRMRDRPGLDGEKIVTIPHHSRVNLLKESGELLTISGATGRWSQVGWQDYEGWVFGGFLSDRPLSLQTIVEQIQSMDYIENSVLFYTKKEESDGILFTIYSINDRGENLREIYSFTAGEKEKFQIELFQSKKGVIKITKVRNDWPDGIYYHYSLFIDPQGNRVGKITYDPTINDMLAHEYSPDGRYSAAYIPFESMVEGFRHDQVVITDNITGKEIFTFTYDELDDESRLVPYGWGANNELYIQAVGEMYSNKRAILFKVEPLDQSVTTFDISGAMERHGTFLNDSLTIYPASGIALGNNFDKSLSPGGNGPQNFAETDYFLLDLTESGNIVEPKVRLLRTGGHMINSYICDEKSLVYNINIDREGTTLIHEVESGSSRPLSGERVSIYAHSTWYGFFVGRVANGDYSIYHPATNEKYPLKGFADAKIKFIGIAEYCPAMTVMYGLRFYR